VGWFARGMAAAGVIAAVSCDGAGPGSVTAVSILEGDQHLVVGDEVTLTADVVASGRVSREVLWASSNESVAIVDDAGRVTAIAAGTATVTATSVADHGVAGDAAILVDPLGMHVWTRQFGTPARDEAVAVAVDADGAIYVVGFTRGTLEQPLQGFSDAFVRKYDFNGDHVWTRQFGSDDADVAAGVAGYTFGALEGDDPGTPDAYLRKFDPGGGVLWTRQFGSTGSDLPFGLAVDADDDLVVAGYTDGAFDGWSTTGGLDAWVVKYDIDGVFIWSRQFGTSSDDYVLGVAVGPGGRIYVAGHTEGALVGNAFGERDAFVRALDGGGAVLWTHQFGTPAIDQAEGIAVDARGDVIVVGSTAGGLEGDAFDGGDAFVRKLDADGGVTWTRQFGTTAIDAASAVAVDPADRIVLVGHTLGALEGTPGGEEDGFVRVYGR
jgi:hypothetical protein